MADLRIPPQTQPLAAPSRASSARAAQAAFFRAAMGAEPVQAPAAPQPVKAATTTEQQPQRYARPGSLVDIKV